MESIDNDILTSLKKRGRVVVFTKDISVFNLQKMRQLNWSQIATGCKLLNIPVCSLK